MIPREIENRDPQKQGYYVHKHEPDLIPMLLNVFKAFEIRN